MAYEYAYGAPDRQVVRVHREDVLRSAHAAHCLAVRLCELPESRREMPNWLLHTLGPFIERGGVIVSGEGREIVIHDDTIDGVHGDDGSFAWVSAQRRRAANPPRRRSRKTMLPRLQLYDAAFRIATGRSYVAEGEVASSTSDGDR